MSRYRSTFRFAIFQHSTNHFVWNVDSGQDPKLEFRKPGQGADLLAGPVVRFNETSYLCSCSSRTDDSGLFFYET